MNKKALRDSLLSTHLKIPDLNYEELWDAEDLDIATDPVTGVPVVTLKLGDVI